MRLKVHITREIQVDDIDPKACNISCMYKGKVYGWDYCSCFDAKLYPKTEPNTYRCSECLNNEIGE